MACDDARNRIKLNLVLGHACQVLRELFQTSWKEKFGSEWSKDLSYRILGHDLKNIEPIHSKLIEEGNIDKWDLTTLRAILTAEDLLNLPASQTSRIMEIDSIQKEIGLLTSSFDEAEFSVWFGKLKSILTFFGLSDNVLDRIKQSKQENLQASSGATNLTDRGETSTFSKKLDDATRMNRVNTHRQWLNECHTLSNQMLASAAFAQANRTFKVPLTQELPQNFAGFKPIMILDMIPFYDRVYKGRILTVTVFDEPGFTGSSIMLIIEDENRDAERCAIYGSPHMSNEAKVRQVFGPGCKMIIINPYMRMAFDGRPLIRVDDPATIVMRGYVPSMCRYCGKPNAAKLCSSCKGAWYCDRTCQKLDWEKLNHKLICHKFIPTPSGFSF